MDEREITRQILFETSLQTMLGFVLGAIASLAVITFLGTITIQSVSTGLEEHPHDNNDAVGTFSRYCSGIFWPDCCDLSPRVIPPGEENSSN